MIAAEEPAVLLFGKRVDPPGVVLKSVGFGMDGSDAPV
jgi:hypothetical protein